MSSNPKILLIALCTLCIFCSAFSFTHSIPSNKNEFKTTTDPHEQRFPSIYQNIVVWQDNRNGNWDIYGLKLIPPYEKALNQTRVRVIFVDYMWSFIIGSALLLMVILAGATIYYLKKFTRTPSSAGKASNFKRGNIQFFYLLFSGFYLLMGIFFIFLNEFPFSGHISLILSVILGFEFFWVRKTPYVRIHDNEILLFPTMGWKPQVITRDTIQEMGIKREPNTNMPETVEFILTSGEKRKIEIFLAPVKDRQSLVKALKEFMS